MTAKKNHNHPLGIRNFIEGVVTGVVLLTIFPGLLYAGCPGIERIKNTVPAGNYSVTFLKKFADEMGKEDTLFYLLNTNVLIYFTPHPPLPLKGGGLGRG
jgi:hypothetical protein